VAKEMLHPRGAERDRKKVAPGVASRGGSFVKESGTKAYDSSETKFPEESPWSLSCIARIALSPLPKTPAI
jgi:hypothetical protein